MAHVLLVDEQPLTRHALRVLLEEDGHRVVGECADGVEALQLVQRLPVELLVLDLVLPRLGGLEVIQRLRQRGNSLPVLVFSSQVSQHHAALSLQAGATGFVGKQQDPATLRAAVRSVLQGASYFPAQALGTVAPGELMRDEASQLRSLSPRELTVLRYLANGVSNAKIAKELALNDRTVSTYKTRLLHKLNVASLAELLELAWRNGLLGRLPETAGEAEGRERFYTLFDTLPIPACLRDLEGRLLACNQQFLALHGVEREALLGRRVAELVNLAPEDVKRYSELYRQAVASGGPYSCEVIIQRGGMQQCLRHSGVPWQNEGGALAGMLCTVVDITEQQREIAELAQAKVRGEQRRRLREQFLQAAGQELLTQLRQLQQLLPSTGEPAAQELVGRLERLLEALLDLVRLERGDVVLEPQRADLSRLTEEIATGISAAHYELPGVAAVRIDVRRYRQLLTALLEHCTGERVPVLQGQLTHLTHGEADWHLQLQPCPAPVGHSVSLALATQLAALMGGELSWDGNTARLRLRLLQAL
ncbi:response regulator [Pseudomonas sp. UL073]|uniref:Response regulator n=1 Tax=Zestomonas insulae TaxID=2809017 RepID=A0ABS2IH75_9GAMM|nr:response regulator [Pseudomonas insulae]MBM7061694.1 response regulator [Pseudomonas insulae]